MRVVIGEDEPLLREGLALLLSRNGFDVTAAVGDAEALRASTAVEHPDVVVTDIRMPPGETDDGLRAALDIRRGDPPIPVLVLSQHVSRRYVTTLLGDRTGGVGYLLKHRVTDVEGFCDDLIRVAKGGVVLDPEVVSVMVGRSARDDGRVDRLTPRQLQVLGLVAEGRSNLAIATRLGITEKAVARHAAQIYDTLDLPPSLDDHRRVLAVVRFLDR
ncbi:MAG: response regulator transcription factor [Pseudonocardia sp.]|uniref:response regulator n=1 Tax=unclassified Pseudonocardia TaxID=2619320 RepID=UPI00086BB6B5|nr:MULTISPECIES: response regulator transcription factor [unclassified Pseudonocardia]MBN9112271.1 response regulator transcription factor [Pseudonocardia sp.]ODU28465.1 MAG: DNA-binding response regulator [Pseudonocardia sp. SCN 72-51]ODU99812.1 MAG: DNA-binding response regulator [Pseudonocardia sp. SCN 73-27]